MSKQTQINIGLFGFGVVGESLWQVLQTNTSLNAQIKKVCIKHPDKKRNAPDSLFTVNKDEILNDDSINVVIELIDDADAAYSIVSKALTHGKSVVSANKKMIAEHLEELLALQRQHKVSFLYEAACCASIPVIRNLEEYYDNDLLQSVSGIVNGSTNYILTRIAEEGLSFNNALALAQDNGFAESDPSLDIEGVDAVNKLSILLIHAYGIIANPRELVYGGIHRLQHYDALYAKEKGYKIKLVAHAVKLENGGVASFVLPHFLTSDHSLFPIRNEYNGVVIESGLADKQLFTGKGAGGYPTASAVISDISALRYSYKYEYRKFSRQGVLQLTNDFFLRIYLSFDDQYNSARQAFEHIEEWGVNDSRSYIVGVIHFSKLVESNWWKKRGTSIILLPNAFVSIAEWSAYKRREELVGI